VEILFAGQNSLKVHSKRLINQQNVCKLIKPTYMLDLHLLHHEKVRTTVIYQKEGPYYIFLVIIILFKFLFCGYNAWIEPIRGQAGFLLMSC
jgi:hypothetical protein